MDKPNESPEIKAAGDRARAALLARVAAWERFDRAFSAGEDVRALADEVEAAEAEHALAADGLLALLGCQASLPLAARVAVHVEKSIAWCLAAEDAAGRALQLLRERGTEGTEGAAVIAELERLLVEREPIAQERRELVQIGGARG